MSRDSRRTSDALRHAASTLALLIGSALPVIIAIVLVASTNEGNNPLDRIPEYSDPLVETLSVPLGSNEPVQTQYRYYGRVRLVFEGSGSLADGAVIDVFYRLDQAGTGAPALTSTLAIDGTPALEALGLRAEPPAYADDHLYSAIYDLGGDYRRLQFTVIPDGLGGSGAFTITVVQLR
ncbi:MAG: hypothetical protein Kow00106_23940 [Anaerolineae bacterium]